MRQFINASACQNLSLLYQYNIPRIHTQASVGDIFLLNVVCMPPLGLHKSTIRSF